MNRIKRQLDEEEIDKQYLNKAQKELKDEENALIRKQKLFLKEKSQQDKMMIEIQKNKIQRQQQERNQEI